MVKCIVELNIISAEKRRIEAFPYDPLTVRFWEGYITALNSIISFLPEEKELLYIQEQLKFSY